MQSSINGVTSKQLLFSWSTRQISILLTIIALILWSYSITQAKLNIGFFGLIHTFPITFFLALDILIIASAILWISKENYEKLLFLQLSFLVLSIWLVPLLIGGSQPGAVHIREKFFDGFTPLVKEGHFDPRKAWYHNWPGLFILTAALTNITKINNLEPVFILMPFLLQLAFLLIIYVFLKNLLDQTKVNYCWAGILIFELANWLEQNYLGPQAYGLLLLLFILFLFTKTSMREREDAKLGYQLFNILFFICLTITHLLTSLVGLTSTIVLFFFRRIKRLLFVVLVAIFTAGWMIYQTMSFFESKVLWYIEHAFQLDLLMFGKGPNIGSVVMGNTSHQVVSIVRILLTGVFIAIAFAGFLLGRRFRKKIYNDNTVLAIGISFIFILLSTLYPYELLQRTWFFMLPVVAYFGVKLLSYKSTLLVLCILLPFALSMHFIAHYGNQSADYRSPSYVAGSKYVKNLNIDTHTIIKLDLVGLRSKKLNFENIFSSQIQYCAISKRADNRWDFLHNEPYFIDKMWAQLDKSNKYNCVYSNPSFGIYLRKEF